MSKQRSMLTPYELVGGIVILRLYRYDGTFKAIDLDSRDMVTAYKKACSLIRTGESDVYREVQLWCVQANGDCVQAHDTFVTSWELMDRVFKYYVKWQDDDGREYSRRFVKRSAAFSAYCDLQRQDYLTLTTNSHSRKRIKI